MTPKKYKKLALIKPCLNIFYFHIGFLQKRGDCLMEKLNFGFYVVYFMLPHPPSRVHILKMNSLMSFGELKPIILYILLPSQIPMSKNMKKWGSRRELTLRPLAITIPRHFEPESWGALLSSIVLWFPMWFSVHEKFKGKKQQSS